jgi:type I restriction enzyme R subunit
MTGPGIGENRDPNMVLLQEAIDKLNEYWGGDETEADRRNFVVHIVDKALEDATLSEQARVNSLEQFLNSPDLKNAVIATAIDAERNKSDMTQSLLNSPTGIDKLVELIGELIHLKFHTA